MVALSNHPENLMKLKKEYPAIEILNVDLCDWKKTREALNALGPFHGLVNSAGIIFIESFLECKPDSLDSFEK